MRSVLLSAFVVVVLGGAAWWLGKRRDADAEPRVNAAAPPSPSTQAANAATAQTPETDAGPGDGVAGVDPSERGATETMPSVSTSLPDDDPSASGRAAPRLVGDLVIPPGFASDQFRVSYRRSTRGDPRPIKLFANGSFRLFTAEPGPVSLFVELVGDPSPLRVVPDVLIPTEGACADPRLAGIELSELRLVKLRVVAANGAPTNGPIGVLVLPPRGVVGRRHFFRAADVVLVPARERPQRLQVWSRGYAAATVEVHDEETVRLPAPATVSLTARVDPAVCRDRIVLVGLKALDQVEELRPLPPLGDDMQQRVFDGTVADVALAHDVVVLSTLEPTGTETLRIALAGQFQVAWRTSGPPDTVRGLGPKLDVVVGHDYELTFELTAEAFAAAAGR